jgi:hypothetical protein
MIGFALLSATVFAQGKRLWVLKESGEMVEYDLTTYAAKLTVKVPAEAVKSPTSLSVNRAGQMLFYLPVTLPLSESDTSAPHKAWFWNGQAAATIDLAVERKVEETGSNQAVSESAPALSLSADGKHLFWFANQARRLQREEVDLSTATTWQAWQSDLSGGSREDIASTKLPDCRCTTGSCEESCPSGVAWAPDGGIDRFFLMTQFVVGQTTPSYKASTRYQEESGKWSATAFGDPLKRVLDASSDGTAVIEAIPDTGCCGWTNQSDDQTLVVAGGKTRTVFDERETYKNPDYDVSFYSSNARLSPDQGLVAMTIVSTAQANKPIQLAEGGEASPEESARIRKALPDLPAVAVKSNDDTPKQVAFVPHATLVGWIGEKELLLVEEHLLVVYNIATGARKKSTLRVEDAAHVFLR